MTRGRDKSVRGKVSLSRASDAQGRPLTPPGQPPYPTDVLEPLARAAFELPPDDPWVLGTGTSAHGYLDAARQAWRTHPEWMDALDLESPAWDLKRAARDLYLRLWNPWLREGRALDVGCGVGRLTTILLDRGMDVWGVDPDLESLRRCLRHAIGRPGRLDLHWSSAHQLPEVEVDVAIACEVLCYVPDAKGALAAIVERLTEGGVVCLSLEARWGWAAADDAGPDLADVALGDAQIVDRPGEQWVRVYDRADVVALLREAGLEVELLERTHYLTDGPLEGVMPTEISLEQLLELEERCRRHPVWAPLHRIWTAVGRKAR